MNELVRIKKDEVYTDTFIIATGTENQHESIKRLISSYEKQFLSLGTLPILNREINRAETRGRKEEIYELNEPQATFLMTLLRNSEVVVEFKLKLVTEFFRMRRFIMERQTAEWQTSRVVGKEIRKQETDIILTKLIPLAESQGSENAGLLYMNYSKLVNMVLGIKSGQRDNLPVNYVDTIRFLEKAIENIISLEADKGTHYKEIYQICKAKCVIIKELAFLPRLEPLKLNA